MIHPHAQALAEAMRLAYPAIREWVLAEGTTHAATAGLGAVYALKDALGNSDELRTVVREMRNLRGPAQEATVRGWADRVTR